MAEEKSGDVSITPEAGELAIVGGCPSIEMGPLFEALLNSAKHLLSIGEHRAAVLVAQTAIEVCTERIISGSLEKHDAAVLRDWIHSRARPYVLGSENKATKELYELLTGDDQIGQAPFWHRLTQHVKRRHAVGHRGETVEQKDAADSVTVAGEAIRHISAVAARIGLDLSD